MKFRLISLSATAIVIGSLSVCLTDAQEKSSDREPPSIWMKKKLEHAQKILAGLTEADFDKIRLNAQDLNFLNALEKWERSDMPEYKRQLGFFEFANRELIRQASEKNLDGAMLAYHQLTISCMQCHRVVRDSKKK